MRAYQCLAKTSDSEKLQPSHKLLPYNLTYSEPSKFRLEMTEKSYISKKLLKEASRNGQIDSFVKCAGLTNNTYLMSLEVLGQV